MGLQTLPNGIEYFSLSEELEVFTEILYNALTPLNVGILIIITMIFIGMIVFMAMYVSSKTIKQTLQ